MLEGLKQVDIHSALDLLVKRFAWVADHPEYQKYVDGMPRMTGGSYVEEVDDMESLKLFLVELDLYDGRSLMPESAIKPECEYYVARVPEGFNAWQAAATFGSLSDEQKKNASFKFGHGQWQLFLADLEPVKTDIVTLICDADGLVTWHPGLASAVIDIDNLTVKLG